MHVPDAEVECERTVLVAREDPRHAIVLVVLQKDDLVLGGRGTYLGTVAGVLLITLLQSILSVVQPQYMLADLGLKVPPESIRQIVFGLVIVGMMLIYGRERLIR